jgi:hypothetical protein
MSDQCEAVLYADPDHTEIIYCDNMPSNELDGKWLCPWCYRSAEQLEILRDLISILVLDPKGARFYAERAERQVSDRAEARLKGLTDE